MPPTSPTRRSPNNALRSRHTCRLRQILRPVLPAGAERHRAGLDLLAVQQEAVRRRRPIAGARRGGQAMAGLGERDDVSGQVTTGHEWNGIKELNTPVPRIIWIF